MTTQRLEIRLYENHTLDELAAMMREILADKQPQPNSLYIYSKAQRTRMDAIAWAITWKMQEAKEMAR